MGMPGPPRQRAAAQTSVFGADQSPMPARSDCRSWWGAAAAPRSASALLKRLERVDRCLVDKSLRLTEGAKSPRRSTGGRRRERGAAAHSKPRRGEPPRAGRGDRAAAKDGDLTPARRSASMRRSAGRLGPRRRTRRSGRRPTPVDRVGRRRRCVRCSRGRVADARSDHGVSPAIIRRRRSAPIPSSNRLSLRSRRACGRQRRTGVRRHQFASGLGAPRLPQAVPLMPAPQARAVSTGHEAYRLWRVRHSARVSTRRVACA